MIQSIEDGNKEDGKRSIADKIIKRLHDLNKTVINNQGRWVWELLQNAKDSIANTIDSKISIKIILTENQVEFKHNGIHFTEMDIIFKRSYIRREYRENRKIWNRFFDYTFIIKSC